jgi:hypothetical protein
MVQGVITRLGNDSFLVKGWAVTVTGVFLGFAVSSKHAALAFVALVPICFFWGLDAYYLRSERLFRMFYERVRQGSDGVTPFGMDATGPAFLATLDQETRGGATVWRTSWRPTLVVLYLGLALSASVAGGVLAVVDQPASHASAGAGCSHAAGKVAHKC